MRTCDNEIKEGSMHFLPFILTLSVSLRVGVQAYYQRNKLRKKDTTCTFKIEVQKNPSVFHRF